MTPAARSVLVFGSYLVVLGAVLIGSPNILLALVKQPAANEPWIHVLGVPIMAMGILHVASARSNLVPFFHVSIRVRPLVLVSFAVLAALRMIPPIVIGFGLVDVAAGAWTWMLLRQSHSLGSSSV